MLQVDHVYEFFYDKIFKDFLFWYLDRGVPIIVNASRSDIMVFTQTPHAERKIFFYDQEPVLLSTTKPYLDHLENIPVPGVFVSSEKSRLVTDICTKYKLSSLYYFFHGFAALDWFRGYHTLNYNKPMTEQPKKDFITYNRLIYGDRSFRIYFVSLLKEHQLLNQGLVSFGVTDNDESDWRVEVTDPQTKLSYNAIQHIQTHMAKLDKLVIDRPYVHGSASADIPRTLDIHDENNNVKDYSAFWHVVTETVFYYDKLHLTEKTFKPIVSKQPFILLAAPGNLAYLKHYGFKSFSPFIDESYDDIKDNDQRIEFVVQELHRYCNLSAGEKLEIAREIAPIVEHNFNHFYSDFKHVITKELLENCQTLFKELGYDDSHIDYKAIYKVLTH